MDLLNYGYSSDEESPPRKRSADDGRQNDENSSASSSERNGRNKVDEDEAMETDSIGIEPDSTPGGSVATPQQQPMDESPKQRSEKPELIYDDDGLPPPPTDKCSDELRNRFIQLFKIKATGVSMNAQILNRKEFKNPAIYDKLKSDYQVNEYGTNYSCEGKDHIPLEASDYYDKLAEEQSTVMEKEDQLKKTAPAQTTTTTSHSGKDRHSRFSKK